MLAGDDEKYTMQREAIPPLGFMWSGMESRVVWHTDLAVDLNVAILDHVLAILARPEPLALQNLVQRQPLRGGACQTVHA